MTEQMLALIFIIILLYMCVTYVFLYFRMGGSVGNDGRGGWDTSSKDMWYCVGWPLLTIYCVFWICTQLANNIVVYLLLLIGFRYKRTKMYCEINRICNEKI